MAIPFSELNKINPSSIIELFELQLTVGVHVPSPNSQNLPTVYRFHAGANLNNFGEIKYLQNSYQRVAVQAEGFERKSTGTIPRPTMTFSNLGGINYSPSGATITMTDFLQIINLVTPNNDLLGATIIRLMPLASSLDTTNFTSGVNPFNSSVGSSGLADRLRDEIFVIDRKAIESRQIVQFELTGANDLENKRIPQRVVTRKLFPAVGTFI